MKMRVVALFNLFKSNMLTGSVPLRNLQTESLPENEVLLKYTSFAYYCKKEECSTELTSL